MAQMTFDARQSPGERIAAYAFKLSKEDTFLRKIRKESDEHRAQHDCDVHPSSPVTGRLLNILVRSTGARRVLEVGCGLGYSAIWIARALPPGGRVDTIEQDPLHVKLASENFKASGLRNRTRILRGEASSVLSRLKDRYDFIFEDATFGERPRHYEDLIRLLRIGGYIQFANWFPIEHAIVGGRSLKRWKKSFPTSSHAPAATQRFVAEVFLDMRLSAVLLPHIWNGIAVKIRN